MTKPSSRTTPKPEASTAPVAATPEGTPEIVAPDMAPPAPAANFKPLAKIASDALAETPTGNPAQAAQPSPAPVANPIDSNPAGELSVAPEPISSPVSDFHYAVPTDALAKEYFEIAVLFEGEVSPVPGISISHLKRLSAQHYCMALETECQKRFDPGVKRFWSQRKTGVPQWLKPETSGLVEDLATAVGQLQTKHTDWLDAGGFPSGTLAAILRYFLNSGSENFRPSLIECGFLAWLFGPEQTIGSLKTNNLLGLVGISTDGCIELCLRLTRIQKTRNKLFSMGFNLSDEAHSTLKKDLKRVSELLAAITTGASSG